MGDGDCDQTNIRYTNGLDWILSFVIAVIYKILSKLLTNIVIEDAFSYDSDVFITYIK